MMNELPQTRQHLAQLHQHLLETIRLEQWEEVTTGIPLYLAATEQMMMAWQLATVPEEKTEIAGFLQAMQIDQAEIVGRLRSRMVRLEDKMMKLQQGKSGCQHYAAQITGRFV